MCAFSATADHIPECRIVAGRLSRGERLGPCVSHESGRRPGFLARRLQLRLPCALRLDCHAAIALALRRHDDLACLCIKLDRRGRALVWHLYDHR
jgi:hypothetical protein